eukprot:m.265145 g.265145  ORF g.265145 m.265145 type:complete len:270 (-) comp60154_c0_seq1:298-1107(-)
MGAEQSQLTNPKKRSASAIDDAPTEDIADTQPEVTSSKKKKHRAASRRKSSGRNDRKSLLPSELPEQSLTAFHNDISKDLPDAERLAKLTEETFMYASRMVSETSKDDDAKDMQALARKMMTGWAAKQTTNETWTTATEPAVLRQNPRNSEMQHSLTLYNNTKSRLVAEQATWVEVFERLANQRALRVERTNDSSNEITSEEKNSTDDANVLENTVEAQLLCFEDFTKTCERILEASEQDRGNVKRTVASTRFKGYLDIDDPKKLISGL